MSTLHALLGPASPDAPAPTPIEWALAALAAAGIAIGAVLGLWALVSLAVLAYA